jgi:hypothetical protein
MKTYIEKEEGEDEDEEEAEVSFYTNYCATAVYSNYFENGRNNCARKWERSYSERVKSVCHFIKKKKCSPMPSCGFAQVVTLTCINLLFV